MKKTEFLTELKGKSSEQLEMELVSAKKELFNLRFQNAMNQLDNPMRIAAVKKDIAKLKTVLKEQELGLNANMN